VLLVAVALQVVFQVLFAGIYHTAFLAVGVESGGGGRCRSCAAHWR